MRHLKYILISLIPVILSCGLANGKILTATEYNFPIKDGDIATLSSAITYVPKQKPIVSKLVSKYLRELPYFKGDKDYNIRFYESRFSNAPLVFLISGLGGSGKGPTADYLSHLLNDEGYNVLVLPNTITSQFATSLSRTGYVGKTNSDAGDLYKTIYYLKKHYQSKFKHISRRSHLIGYSHGALLAAHLSEIDSWQRRNNFEKVLLINPPINLVGGMGKLDADYVNGDKKLSAFKKIIALIRAGKGVLKFKKKANTYSNFKKFSEELKVSNEAVKYLISKTMKSSFKDVVLATQDIVDLEVLPSREITSKGKVKQKERKKKAKKVSYVDYASNVLVEYLNTFSNSIKEHTVETVNQESSLYLLEPHLKHSHNIYLMHNQDDFLLNPGDDKYLDSIFNDRALIFPDGGHLGNLWHTTNSGQILEWLR